MSAAASVARAQEALRLGRRARIVTHARLVPARDEDAAQMRFAVEDALNTVDFGDCGRLIVVRRLRLPAVPPRAGPALMARALETAWRSLGSRALSANDARAQDADAVFFSSRIEARLEWLKRAARQADVSAWYWTAALPELKLSASHGDMPATMAIVIEALVQEASVEAAHALRAWPDDTCAALARQLPADASSRLLGMLASTSAPANVSAVAEEATQALAARHNDVEWQPIARRLARQAPLAEAAAAWLAALWVTPQLGAAPTVAQVRAIVAGSVGFTKVEDPKEPEVPSRRLARRDASHAAGAGDSGRGARETRGADIATPMANAAMSSTPPDNGNESPSTAWRMEAGLQPAPRSSSKPRVRRSTKPSALPWLADAAQTSHGGLLCLVNLLQSMRFGRWLDDQAASARRPFVNALFAHALSVCGPTPDDPQFAWFELSAHDDAVLSAARFVVGRVDMDTARALRTWRLRMRRTLRRYVGADLRDVVQRSAWVSGTATHVDVVFPLDEVDLRLRRRSLDSDPGWVPWFGRIVAFHFVDRELLPQRVGDEGEGGG